MDKLLKILQEIRPEFDFSESHDLLADGMLDSFDVVTLVSMLDAAYGISIPGVAIVPENFRNIIAIQQLVERCAAKP